MLPTKKLKLALQANAIFSTLSGLAMVFFHSFIATYMGISQPKILLFIGIGLLLFAFSLLRTSHQEDISAQQVRIIIWQDWAWVLGSLLIITTQAFGISFVGYILIGVVALIVADFAILQQVFLKQIAKN